MLLDKEHNLSEKLSGLNDMNFKSGIFLFPIYIGQYKLMIKTQNINIKTV